MTFSEWAQDRFVSQKGLYSYYMVEAGWDAASEQSSAEIDRLRSALKVIYTWAAFDDAEKARVALTPEHVMELADKALRGE